MHRNIDMKQVSSLTADVVVIGLGPVGAVVANFLGRYGLNVLVIDKATEIFAAPRAIALDNEALRILQMCGLPEGAFETRAIPYVRMHSPRFGLCGAANTAGQIDGHPKLVTFFQPELEQALRAQLAQYPSVQCLLGTTLLGLEEKNEQVQLDLQHADGMRQQVRAHYVVGADGANSTVRSLLGKAFKGQTFSEDWLVVDAKNVPNPIDHVEFICDYRRPTPHMVAPGNRQRWEFKLHPHESREEFESPEKVKELLAPWARAEDIDIERVAVYRFHARLADAFSQGRVFLVGDAAHITPPFIGQGLVAGLRDAANLCWKLAWVVQGRAHPNILESYNTERWPHAKRMITMAKWMGRLVMPSNRWTAFVTHGVMLLLQTIPPLRRHFEELEVKPKNIFDCGLFAGARGASCMKRGAMFPQGWVRRQGVNESLVLSDTAMGNALVMVGLGIDPQAHLSADQTQRWRAAGGHFVQIDPRGHPVHASHTERWEDLSGVIVPGAGPVGWLVVVRPDRTVMHDGPATQASQLMAEALSLLEAKKEHLSFQPVAGGHA
jgi:3-(3-hydroxy-phenyl)propionate hydroxylase